MNWQGVMPAITTPFTGGLAVDHEHLAAHTAWLVEHGASAIVTLGSLGEGATLGFDEKLAVTATCIRGAAGRVPVVAGIAALATHEAVELTHRVAALGCAGIMVLPPYVHRGTWREIRTHLAAILRASSLPAMLYNNPTAYGTDVRPEQIGELLEPHPNLVAVKESSGDVRRITAIRALYGDRLAISVGLDDAVVEGVRAGAVGWVAGLVNALPAESVELFARARAGSDAEAATLYRWFLPLLRLDTVPEFVQLIKLVQQEVKMGSEQVRPPRLPLKGAAREQALDVIRRALSERRGVLEGGGS